MAAILDVLPYDGGWCVKIGETGEVLLFTARRRAIAQARKLVEDRPIAFKVKVHARRPPTVENWTSPTTTCAYPLGAPA